MLKLPIIIICIIGESATSPSMTVQSGVEAMDISGNSGDTEEKKTLVRLCKTGISSC